MRPVQRLLQAKRRLRVAATMRLSRLPWSQLRQSSQRLRLPQSQLPFQPVLQRLGQPRAPGMVQRAKGTFKHHAEAGG